MTPYQQFLDEIKSFAEPDYRDFHKKLLKNDKINVLGVRVPTLRKLAKKYKGEVDNILTFPDEYYEVTFIKLTAVALLDYDNFLERLDTCVNLIDNWATCDCFVPKCIAKHKDEFLPVITKYAAMKGEFEQRFALTTLLHFYVDEKYLETIFSLVERCDTSKYYVHMAAAWLIAETLAKYFPRARDFLNKNSLDKKTHNKAIQKACESFRLSNDDKNYLKGIKR
ncbi:MAG: DNA alkylation repair protein [Clostridiales bacterium]|nr:DNA alkylation repair protein [Clostridiales bacterium]